MKNKKRLFIVWGRELQLSLNLGRALDAEVRQIYYKRFLGLPMPAILRYFAQGIVTLFVLFKERPNIVFVQNPPVVAPLVVWLYCSLFRARMVIDSHTAAFLDQKWKNLYFLFCFVAKRAVLNTCHNYKNLEILKSWEVEPSMVVQFYNPTYDDYILDQPLKNKILDKCFQGDILPIMMVNRFAPDDDFETVIKTAELMPEAIFFVTGDISKHLKLIERISQPNIVFTDYLEHTEFLKLMKRCRVVLAFTLRPDTVLWSVREIMALGKPFVTTDSEVMRHYFSEIGQFAKSDPQIIKEKIEVAIKNENEIKNNIKNFLTKDKVRWEEEIKEVRRLIEK